MITSTIKQHEPHMYANIFGFFVVADYDILVFILSHCITALT